MSTSADPIQHARESLQQLLDNFQRVLANKPVRDAEETIAAAKAALQGLDSLEPPTIVIDITGGVVVDVNADQRARVIVLDSDTEGADPETLKMIDGDETWVQDHVFGPGRKDLHPILVKETISDVDADQSTAAAKLALRGPV